MAFSAFFNNLWDKIKASPTFVPTYIEFSPEQTDEMDALHQAFDATLHYFSISVNEMFLSDKRQWHMEVDPMVFSVCNFQYDGSTLETPFIIGPSSLKKYREYVPQGMLYKNTPVVGIYPWRGGNVALSIILCKVERQNNIEKILNVVEEVANSLDFSKSLSNSLKISKVIMNGINALLGFQETQPIIGINNNFGQAANNLFKSGYYALINDNNIDKYKFWVKNNELNYGNSLETSVPYRGDDFVLFKIGLAYKRDDEQSLPFYQEYKKIYEYIKNQVELDVKQRDNLKSRLTQLAVAIKLSPDLTAKQADIIWKEKKEEIEGFVNMIAKLDGTEHAKEIDTIDQIMNTAKDDLNF